jgi:chemotaxis protein methyltransferase CheR
VSAGSAPGEDPLISQDPEVFLEQPPHLSVSPALFQKFQKLIYAETGIWLGNSKTALLCGRLFRRLRELEITSLKDYYELVSQPEQHEECARMIDAITTNETRFFREPRQFQFLVQTAIPRWMGESEHGARAKRLRIWSAGCSSGEEPYTLAMLLAAHLPMEDWDVRIVATDISNRVLEKASKGVYPIARASELPQELLRTFMLRGTGVREGEMKVKIELQRMIDFRRLNLNEGANLPEGPFDAIFCRNVLIYFDVASKQRVVTNLIRHLIANGLIFVGHAENLTNMTNELRSLESTIYIKEENTNTERNVAT